MMQKIGDTINSNIKKHKLDGKIRALQVAKFWEKVISELLPHAANQTMAVAFEKGVLKVASLSKEIAYEIKVYAQRLMHALNEMLGKRLVYALHLES